MKADKQLEARRMLADLEALAANLGVEVRREILEESRSGLCRIYGRYLLFVDPGLALLDQVDVYARALASFPTDHLFLRPRIRQLLERAAIESHVGPAEDR